MPEMTRTEELICRDCGEARSVKVADHAWPCGAVRDLRGFVVDSMEVSLRGRCPACASISH